MSDFGYVDVSLPGIPQKVVRRSKDHPERWYASDGLWYPSRMVTPIQVVGDGQVAVDAADVYAAHSELHRHALRPDLVDRLRTGLGAAWTEEPDPRTKALKAATDAYWGYMQEVEDNRAAFGKNPKGMHGSIIAEITDAVLKAMDDDR